MVAEVGVIATVIVVGIIVVIRNVAIVETNLSTGCEEDNTGQSV